MNGKIIKISSNDLYGNADDREVVVFAAFNHIKYMNKYLIFTFKDEYAKKKIYYGSVHFKKDSLVIFEVANNVKPFIDEFISSYINNQLDPKDYEILDISEYKKVELVSYNEEDCDQLEKLDEISIKREVTIEETTNKKPTILYVLLIIMILLLGGITYLYFFPEKFTIELKQLECNSILYNNQLEMNYNSTRTILFNSSDKLREINVIDTYKFDDILKYNEFKENNKESIYFNELNGAYKYDDDNIELKIIYKEESIIEEYQDMLQFLKKEGYTCTEGKYYE